MSKRPRWVANKNTRELHRCIPGEVHDPRCHFDEITNKVPFKTATAARKAGMDVSAWCTKRLKSKENT